MKKLISNYIQTKKRIELKEVFKIQDKFLIDRAINISRFSFQKSFPDRTVNSVYFDTFDFKALEDSLEGGSIRKKTRIRWYGNGKESTNATCEIKIKHGHLSWKKLFPDSHLVCPIANSWSKFVSTHIKNDSLEFHMQNLFPKSIVSYKRSYFNSFDKRVRLTIDHNLMSYPQYNSLVPNFRFKEYHHGNIIFEIKIDEDNFSILKEVLKDLPFSSTRFSKYCESIKR